MAIGAGGLIKQNINRDPYPKSAWDPARTAVINVQMLNAAVFKSLTGLNPPVPPPEIREYAEELGLFFDLDEDDDDRVDNVGDGFKGAGVKSVGKMKGQQDEAVRPLAVTINRSKPMMIFRHTSDIMKSMEEGKEEADDDEEEMEDDYDADEEETEDDEEDEDDEEEDDGEFEMGGM